MGMGIAFVTGGAIGSACGYAAGVANGKAKAVDASGAAEELKPSGNADLDEVRRLAVKAPIEELMAVADSFLASAFRDYSTDKVVWRGLGRISEYVLGHPEVENRRALAGMLVQIFERAPTAVRGDYSEWIPRLQAIR